jgi:hypothetical protein
MKKNLSKKAKKKVTVAPALKTKRSLKKVGIGGVTVVKAGSSLAALLLSENDTYAAY